MNKYGECAVSAVKILQSDSKQSPEDAWYNSAEKIWPNSQSSQDKGCPRHAFLGLCFADEIVGITKQDPEFYDWSVNASYAVEAVEILREKPQLSDDVKRLWQATMRKSESGDIGKSHNQQMDVVTALWREKLIKI